MKPQQISPCAHVPAFAVMVLALVSGAVLTLAGCASLQIEPLDEQITLTRHALAALTAQPPQAERASPAACPPLAGSQRVMGTVSKR